MNRVDLPGAVLFTLVLAAITALVVWPAPQRASGWRPTLTHRVAVGQSIDLIVPAGTQAVKLVTMAEREGPVQRLTETRPYAVDLTWLAADDTVLTTQRLDLVAPLSVAWPLMGGASSVIGDVLVPRATELSVPEGGLHLRVGVPDGPAVRLRAFRDEPAPFDAPGLALVGLDGRDALALARQVGVPDWSEVTRTEALALAALRWRGLAARQTREAGREPVVTRLPDPPLPAVVLRAAGRDLPAGRALAYEVTGPFHGTLLWDGPTAGVTLSAITADVGEGVVAREAGDAPAWRVGAKALQVHLPAQGPTTLHVHTQDDLAGVQLLVGAEDWVVPPPTSEAVPVGTFADAPGETRWAVAPSSMSLPRQVLGQGQTLTWHLQDAHPTARRVRVEIRPLASGPTSGPATLRVGRGAGAVSTWEDVVLPWVPSAYEQAGPEHGALDPRWVGEAQVRFVRLDPGHDTLSLSVPPGARHDLLVSAALSGLPQGLHEGWDATRTTTMRFDRLARSTWAALVPDGGPTWTLYAAPRRELLGDGLGAGQRSYRSVDATPERGGTPGELWLTPVPATSPPTPPGGAVFCALTANQDTPFRYDAAASQALSGTLAGVVHAPHAQTQAALGGTYAIVLEGNVWRRGRLRSPVVRVAGRAPPTTTARLEALRGTRAWLRTDGSSIPCPEVWRGRRVVRADAAHPARFRITKGAADATVVVGGFSSKGRDLDLLADVPGERASGAVSEAWTSPRRVLHLTALPDQTGMAADTPWLSAMALDGQGFRLYDDVQGTMDLTFTPVGDDTVWLYALIEDVPGVPSPGNEAPVRRVTP